MAIETLNTTPIYGELAAAPFECACGERFRTVDGAIHCRKCRKYCVFGYCTHVIDLRTNDVVYGEVPDYDEYERAEKRAWKRWAAEKKQLDFEQQMWLREGELYEAEMARRAEEAATARKEEREDTLWAIQDKLMGI
tara:strand:+ start:49 stop:459 length:411 start_codon:yes stop_codon:yes gene_type:complete